MCVVSDILKEDRSFVNDLTSEQFLDALVEVFYKKVYEDVDEVTDNLEKCLQVWSDERIVDYLTFVTHRHSKHLNVILFPFCAHQWFEALKRVSDKYLEMDPDEFNRFRTIIDESISKRKARDEH